MERRGRKTNGVIPLELMRALPGAPEEDIEVEATNAQLRANRNEVAVSVSTQTEELSPAQFLRR